jgi:putative peptidoglycan lipid II flippase
MRSFILTALPLMLGQSIVVLDEQLVRIFGSLAGMGVVSHINYARRLMMVPVGIVGQAAAVASYPFMAELFARGKMDEFFATIRMALKNTFFFVFLCSFGMAAVAEPIVGLIFQQGRFGPSDTVATARLLQLYLVSVPIWCFQQILGRAFYAVGDTLSPVVIGTLTTLLVLPLFFLGAIHLGGEGVVMASVLGFLFYSVILSLWWVKRYKGYKIFEGITEKLLRYAIAGLVSLIFAKGFYFVMSSYTSLSDHSFRSYLFSGLVSGSFFCIVWLLSAMLLFKREMLEFAKGCFRKN